MTTPAIKPPSKVQVGEIIKRYLKPTALVDPKTDFPIFYNLFKKYPSIDFWTRHELAFELNSIKWFLTVEGRAQLTTDWTTFHFVLDTESQSDYSERVDVTPDYVREGKKPSTIADFLKIS